MIKNIVLWPSPVLKKKSVDPRGYVSAEDFQKLCQDLKDTVFMAGGLGLSAIQIGVPLRVMVTHFQRQDRMQIWANPVWSPVGTEKVTDEEGCLSLPGIYENVSRFTSVAVQGFDESGGLIFGVFHGYEARVFQHEVDHFDGIVYPDRMDPGARDRIRKQLKGKR